ncbi:protein PAM68, chloroplastic isoform X2 [Neltuma alba]|uniref:protein PAM68, chloroplastic isoform X2 n=1 Tax=Neltuma alba TaxID=207710 RepID=UPI0010A4626D|nr:protein PAM68, chloroplastic-like isoform X2 [Prosopis alba]
MAAPASASTFSNPHLLHKEVINQYEINVKPQFPIQKRESSRFSRFTPLCATLRSSKGFGPSPKKSKKKNKLKKRGSDDDDDNDEEEEELTRDQGVIPEVVTNRMISRMGFSVGIPLAIGLMFFPFFYYLKVGLKIDVPNWVPFIVSFFFFGSALLGVSYGIVSSSWDPLREGSLLGWNEAQKNWPVFWQSIWGGSNTKGK